jgi:hypothetical protein
MLLYMRNDFTEIQQRHILVKGCGKLSAHPDVLKGDHDSSGSLVAIEMGPASPALDEPRQKTPTSQSGSNLQPRKLEVSAEIDVLDPSTTDDPYTSSQEPTVSNIVKVLERIIDDAKRRSADDLGEYIEDWTGFDLVETELLRQLCSPSGFPSPTARTKAVTEFVHATLVIAHWKYYVRSCESRAMWSQQTESTPSRRGIDLSAIPASSGESSEAQIPAANKEIAFTAFPNSLKKLWVFEVATRTVDAFLYRWNTEHSRWLQYRWNAACAIYFCRLHIDGKQRN